MERISNWDDIRFFLAVYRQGSLSGAAGPLGVNHVTVGRRLSTLEESIGAPLFYRSSTGLEPTTLGNLLYGQAQEIASNMAAVERTLRTADCSLQDPVRLTAPGILVGIIVADCIVALHKAHPDIQVELFDHTRIVNLSAREADIGFRMVQNDQSRGTDIIRTRRLCTVDWAFYAHREVIERLKLTPPYDNLHEVPIIDYSDAAPAIFGRDWIETHVTNPTIVFRCNSATGVFETIRRGMGIGMIPVPQGESANLVRISNTVESMKLWLAVHPDLSDNPHIRTVYDFIGHYVVQKW